MRYIIIFFILMFLGTFNRAHSSADIETLTYYAENYPPSNYFAGGELVGVSVEILKLLWSRMGMEEQDIYVVPWARGYKNVLDTPNTMLFTMSRSAKREKLFKWVGPIFVSRHILVSRKETNMKLNSIQDAFGYRIATIRGDISEQSLLDVSFPEQNMAKLTQLNQAFSMLNKSRVDLVMVSLLGFTHLVKERNLSPSDYDIALTVNELGNYFAFNLETPDEIIEKFQRAVDETSVERALINAKYGFSPVQ